MSTIEVPYLRSQDLLPDPDIAFPQTIRLGGGARGATGMTLPAPVVHGAFVRLGSEPPLPLAVSTHYRHDPDRASAVVSGKDLRWLDTLNEAGAASLVVPNDDPLIGTLSADTLVLFEVYGWAAFTMLVRELNVVMASPSEEVGQLTTISGPGSLAILEEALVYPSRGIGAWPIEDERVFSWPAPDYNDWWWGDAGEMAKWSDPTFWTIDSQGGSPPAPSDWPDPDAYWIWDPWQTWRWAPDGTCYTRKQFEVPPGTTRIALFVTCDWHGEIYFDGQHLGTNEWVLTDTRFYSEEIDVTAGIHTIAIECTNDVDPENDRDHNPGGILCAVYSVGNAGRVEPPLVHSDASWRFLPYPPEPPGMTPGEAMEHCLQEARARGLLTDVTWTFTGAVDSAGVPWPVVGDIATKVGYDLLTFFRELTNTYVDLAISPAGSELYAWTQGGRGEDTDIALHGPTDPADPSTGNITQLTYRLAMAGATQLLVRWAGGWNNVPNFPGGNREACLGLGAQQSLDEVQRVGSAQLAAFADQRAEIAVEMAPMGLDDMPVLSFGVADFITVPDRDGPQSQRVIALGAALDDNGRLTWSVELKDRLLDQRERTEQALKKMDNGTLRGSSKIATPTGEIGKRNIPPVNNSAPG